MISHKIRNEHNWQYLSRRHCRRIQWQKQKIFWIYVNTISITIKCSQQEKSNQCLTTRVIFSVDIVMIMRTAITTTATTTYWNIGIYSSSGSTNSRSNNGNNNKARQLKHQHQYHHIDVFIFIFVIVVIVVLYCNSKS